MDWRLFANLAEAAGTRQVTVEAGPGDTFETAFDQLLDAHPELEAEVLDDEGEIRDHIRVLRNDHDPFVTDDGYDTVLEEGDELALFPPVSGGCGAG
ncbi:molybdopterin synthase sulfur carrier subunit [Halobacteriales archaeon QS_1_69_70]|nr:MAG: molybdopterin synthase sulfur carrier subunit [Halobacteriales archaeon QS_1_69_70]